MLKEDQTGQGVLPPEQLASSAELRATVPESGEAIRCQNVVALLPQGIVVGCIPLWQLAGVAPRHQCVLQDGVPLFVS